ncbi:MAG: LGFP repeat-containing protein, partial [Mycobacteriales bacterium]
CGSGYTAFCCTINNGVNRCPPGSLVGGWWKSDNSGFCCGNARYYIDCHSFCACGCEGGRNFCGAGCQNCSCGCGPSGQCDQRKVCCNNFRYGQCNQHISCTGPVWCRVVTCTPPWKVPAWRCSTTSATDQRTNDHGAPCLLDCTPIGQRYTALGGPGSFLGEATTGEKPTPDGRGRYQHFSGGSIYWHPAIGAFSVRGAIRDKWERLRWETGPLGYPVTDENPTPDGRGRFNHFVGGSIYWHPAVGAFSVQGAIRQRWELLGWETGRLGYPTTDETPTSDGVGRFNNYQGGSVYWHPDTGAHSLFEAVRTAWLERGGPSGVLGYPTGEPYRDVDRLLRSDFQGGFITYEPSTGATVVRAGGR